MNAFWRLMYEFMKIGMFAVGGGPATIPFLYDLARRFNYFTTAQLADMIAISQCTPGPVGINMATYVGYNSYGVVGAIMTTFALVLPSLIVIIIISKALNRFRDNKYIDNIFKILRPCVVGFIAAATFTIFSLSALNIDLFNQTHNILDLLMIKEIILFVGLCYLVFKYNKNPMIYLGIAALVGIIFSF